MLRFVFMLSILLLFVQCKDQEEEVIPDHPCPPNAMLNAIDQRNFGMGFGTWLYAPTVEARDDTYDYIFASGDIYLEHMDGNIPWSSWMNGTTLPQDFVGEIDFKVTMRPPDKNLVLAVSALNSGRDDLKEKWDGSILDYDSINDPMIEDAYFEHVKYLIERLDPDYLIASIESNDFLVNSPNQWSAFKSMMQNVRFRLKQEFPELPISESITLHNYYQVDVADPSGFVSEVSELIAQMDFAAISFYPFFKNLSNASDFQDAFDFLHAQVDLPIAIVETNHLAEDLIIPALNINIPGDPCEQKAYLESLLINAQEQDYEFIIWWAHRDYDALWETFPEEVQDLGRIWRDTGLLDENGNERPASRVWQQILVR